MMTHHIREVALKVTKLKRYGLRITGTPDGYVLDSKDTHGEWWPFAVVQDFDEGVAKLEDIYHSQRAGERVTNIPPPNPYPNEWAARQSDPDSFARFRRKAVGHGISLIIGFPSARVRKPGRGESEVQSVRFAKSKWTKPQAREWLAEHDFATRIE